VQSAAVACPARASRAGCSLFMEAWPAQRLAAAAEPTAPWKHLYTMERNYGAGLGRYHDSRRVFAGAFLYAPIRFRIDSC
jgi:hypothetical protein